MSSMLLCITDTDGLVGMPRRKKMSRTTVLTVLSAVAVALLSTPSIAQIQNFEKKEFQLQRVDERQVF
jgi:hypothetical protein